MYIVPEIKSRISQGSFWLHVSASPGNNAGHFKTQINTF